MCVQKANGRGSEGPEAVVHEGLLKKRMLRRVHGIGVHKDRRWTSQGRTSWLYARKSFLPWKGGLLERHRLSLPRSIAAGSGRPSVHRDLEGTLQ